MSLLILKTYNNILIQCRNLQHNTNLEKPSQEQISYTKNRKKFT